MKTLAAMFPTRVFPGFDLYLPSVISFRFIFSCLSSSPCLVGSLSLFATISSQHRPSISQSAAEEANPQQLKRHATLYILVNRPNFTFHTERVMGKNSPKENEARAVTELWGLSSAAAEMLGAKCPINSDMTDEESAEDLLVFQALQSFAVRMT